MTKKETTKKGYDAQDIFVLKGLEPVRKRPGMYIGSTGPEGLHHLIWEVVDNSIDEAMGGHATSIEVTLLPENRVRVADNGRGIPVDKHKDTGVSALETVMTTLHAGAKFESKAYQVSGGLHGVGVSVVNALSVYLRAEVCREGVLYAQEYKRGAPVAPVKKVGTCDSRGTTVIFEPDPTIFKELGFDLAKVLRHLRQQAFLTKGVTIRVVDARGKEELPYTFHFEGGVRSYISYLTKDSKAIHPTPFYVEGAKNDIYVEAAFQYTQEFEMVEESFANNIHTTQGGTHLTGLRAALTRTLNDFARKEGYVKEKEENLSGDDIREGLVTIVSIKIREPQFEGQTKAKLGNTEARIAVEQVVAEKLLEYCDTHPQDARVVIEKCLLAQKARRAAKAARETVLRKGILEGLSLPGKLADCTSKNPEESELFIVEGDSAGGSAKSGRNRWFQAILPLRGKILNVERARLDKMIANKEIKSLVIALGTAIASDFDVEKARYQRIVLMTDADSDGNHIKTLLMTLFYRYFKPVIEKGFLYIAKPPLYKVQSGREVQYVYSEQERTAVVDKLKKDKGAEAKIDLQRYKGLGEMNPSELWETTMDPERRILKQVRIEDGQEADRIFDILMGNEVLPRKKFIQSHAHEAELDV